MLNEKKVINDKLLTFTILAILAGFLLGVGLFIAGAAFVTKNPGLGVIGGLIVVVASMVGHISDKVKKEIRNYINRSM